MLAYRLVLDLYLAVKITSILSLVLQLFWHVLVVIRVIMELTSSPVRGSTIDFSLFWLLLEIRHLCELLVELIHVLALTMSTHLTRSITRHLLRWHQTCSISIGLWLDNLLSLKGLLLSQLLICILINLLWSTIASWGSTSHLLSHHLLECTVISSCSSLTEFEDPLGLIPLIILFLLFFSKLFNIWFRIKACFLRLPFDIVKLWDAFLFW